MTSENEKITKNMIMYVQDTLYVFGGKWRLPIIIAIKQGNSRFTDIKAFIPKITNRVLSKELKELEVNKMVVRTVYDTSPITVEYKISPYCYTAKEIVDSMAAWGKQHREKIKED
ncbi:winged helix-turn-helix transcriptional regulator [Flavobacterium sp.]|uniref:winged helix-turn-helix transcriptional regulator n=1 Tax=Flavobacterium sp. TaxID=239 RepID=UPI00374D831B